MNRHQIYVVVVCFLALVVSANVANAQSKDRDNPTPLKSGEIPGLIDSESRGKFFYYSFVANPGEVIITLTVQPDAPSSTYDTNVQQVSFTLYDRNAESILSKYVTASTYGGDGQVVGRVDITRRQTVTLGIGVSNVVSGKGKYRVRVSGAVEFSGKGVDFDEIQRNNESKPSNCLPKQGTLIIKMKDGSKKIIDLSEAETITVVP